MRNRTSLPREVIYSAILVVLVVVSIGWFAETTYAQDEIVKKRKADIKLTQESVTLIALRDRDLKNIVSDMLNEIKSYNPPEIGQESEQVDKVIEIWMKSRRLFSYYERYQWMQGVDASMAIRPGLTNLFGYTLRKLDWIVQRGSHIPDLKNAYDSIAKRFDKLDSDELIARARDELEAMSR